MSNPNTSSTALTWEEAWRSHMSARGFNCIEDDAPLECERIFKAGWEAREARVKELEDALREELDECEQSEAEWTGWGEGTVPERLTRRIARLRALFAAPEVPKQS